MGPCGASPTSMSGASLLAWCHCFTQNALLTVCSWVGQVDHYTESTGILMYLLSLVHCWSFTFVNDFCLTETCHVTCQSSLCWKTAYLPPSSCALHKAPVLLATSPDMEEPTVAQRFFSTLSWWKHAAGWTERPPWSVLDEDIGRMELTESKEKTPAACTWQNIMLSESCASQSN